MVVAVVLRRAPEHTSLTSLRNSFKGDVNASATFARELIQDALAHDKKLFLSVLKRQLLPNATLSHLWVAAEDKSKCAVAKMMNEHAIHGRGLCAYVPNS